jgi:hypothetical protein
MSLLDRLMPKPAKASTGIGAIWMTNEPSLRSITGNPQDKMREAQEVATSNRWIRAAERVISHQFGTVPWHLETEDGESVTDESPEILKQIRDLIEKPYRVLDGDPISATPKTRAGLWSLTCRHPACAARRSGTRTRRASSTACPLRCCTSTPRA